VTKVASGHGEFMSTRPRKATFGRGAPLRPSLLTPE